MLAISRQGGIHLAEVAALLILIAGVWHAASQIPHLNRPWRTVVVGGLLAVAGLLLIVAIHWGHFGS